MSDAAEGIAIRYVAGFGASKGTLAGYLVRLAESPSGERISSQFIASDITYEQCEHLHLQITNLLAILKPKE